MWGDGDPEVRCDEDRGARRCIRYKSACAAPTKLHRKWCKEKQMQNAFDEANSKLSNGRGNLVGQAQKLSQLGVKPSKSLPAALVDGAYESLIPLLEKMALRMSFIAGASGESEYGRNAAMS